MAISGTGTWSYAFDAGNRLTSTTNPNSETTSMTLDAAGRCTRQDFSNTTYVLMRRPPTASLTSRTARQNPLSVAWRGVCDAYGNGETRQSLAYLLAPSLHFLAALRLSARPSSHFSVPL